MEKYELSKFQAGDTKEHEGVTYKAVRQEQGRMCEGCAFYKGGANRVKALEGGCALR